MQCVEKFIFLPNVKQDDLDVLDNVRHQLDGFEWSQSTKLYMLTKDIKITFKYETARKYIRSSEESHIPIHDKTEMLF